MKYGAIQMNGFTVSDRYRKYSFQVKDADGRVREFIVEVSLELLKTGPLKIQDGPLIAREKLIYEFEREPSDLLIPQQLNVSEPEIHGYIERHYPPKAPPWNPYKAA